MTRSPRFAALDLSDATERLHYEQAFYAVFSRVPSQGLLRQLWVWDDAAGRITTRIPPGDLLVLAMRNAAGGITSAFTINVGMHSFQAAAYGFALPETGGRCCEILAFFAPDTPDLRARVLFWRDTVDTLLGLGFDQAVTTCGPHPLATYLWVGAEKLVETVVQGEQRFFLRFDLLRTRQRLARRSSGRGQPPRQAQDGTSDVAQNR